MLTAAKRLFSGDDRGLLVRKGDYVIRVGKRLSMAEVTAVYEKDDGAEPCWGYSPEPNRVDCGSLVISEREEPSTTHFARRDQVPAWLREEIAEARNDAKHVRREKLVLGWHLGDKGLVLHLARERPPKMQRLRRELEGIKDDFSAEGKEAIQRALLVLDRFM